MNWWVMPEAPRLVAKVAFLTDGRAISYAENYLGIIEHYRLAPSWRGHPAHHPGSADPALPGGQANPPAKIRDFFVRSLDIRPYAF